MDKRYILALVLITIVMIGWMFLQPIIAPKPVRPGQKPVRQTRTTPSAQTETKQQSDLQKTGSVPQERFQKELIKSRQRFLDSPKATVKTSYYDAEFVVDTATVSSWKLNKYLKRNGQNGEVIDLIPFSAIDCSAIKFSGTQLLQLGAMKMKWEVDNPQIVLGPDKNQASMTFTGKIGDKLKIIKKYTFHQDSYVVDLDIKFQNLSDEQYLALTEKDEKGQRNGYILRWGPGITSDDKKVDKRYGAKVYRPKRENSENILPITWAAMNSRYFAAVIIPGKNLKAQYRKNDTLISEDEAQKEYVSSPLDAIDVVIPGFPLKAGESRTDRFALYIGPKKSALLKQVKAPGSEEDIHLNNLIKFGLLNGFFGLARAMVWLLNLFYDITKNYGIAIIIVTTLMKALIYPLTYKSYQSMKEMQKLKEPLEELKEKYRDDPQKLNKATMRLYKEHGVNPLSGCIVWLPQIPIFWAFFSVLREAIELRGAGFMLWIHDLSVADTIGSISGINIRVLPLLMGVAMFLQQRMTGTPGADPRQSKIMGIMPFFFIFIFYGFPSGLVLYWLWNNILTITQQYIINKRGNDSIEKIEQQTKKKTEKRYRRPNKRTLTGKR